VAERVDRAQRRAQVVRHRVRKRLELVVRGLELIGALGDPRLEAAQQLHVLHRDRRRVGERLQEADVGLRWLLLHRPVVADRTHRLEPPDRHHDQALDERGPVRVVRDPRIGVDILEEHRLAVEHRPAADAALEREPLALPQRLDRVFLGVVTTLTVAKHEGRAVRAGQRARRLAHDAHDRIQIARHR
jgi:hypothetical protein